MKLLLTCGLCCVLLVLANNLAWAEVTSPSLWHRFASVLDPRTSPFLLIPEVGTDPNGGTTVGLLPVLLFSDQNHQIRQILNGDVTYNSTLGVGASAQILAYPSDDTNWSVTLGAAEHIDRTVNLSYATGLTRQGPWSLQYRVLFDCDPTERFFGIGNHSDSSEETNYTLEQELINVRLGFNLTPALQVALDLRPRFVAIHKGAFDTLPFPGAQFPGLNGLKGSNEWLNRLVVSYDTRNSLNVPTHGSLLSVWGGITDQSFLSSVSYTTFGGDVRHYEPLTQRVTLAGHLALQYMPVGQETPFWALNALGGDRSVIGERQPLRGFGAERFVDRNLFVGNVEVRTRVLEHDLFGTHAILELAPFFEAGQVFHYVSENPFRSLHPVGGLGLRGIAEPFVVGYVDIGYGSEGTAIFSRINYPF